MGRVLAIDYGTKRCGLAVTDTLRIAASPLTTVHPKDLLDFLSDYISREEVDVLVVGEPIRLSGELSAVEMEIRGFIKKFIKAFPHIPVERENEQYSSKMASQAMVMGGMKKKDRQKKGNLDKVSAAIILQSYLGHSV